MATARLDNVSKRFPDHLAVDRIDLDIREGEFLVLVGPSGCGKSTTLRMIAGLEQATEGDIWIGDRRVNDVSPRDRDVAMVFQNYALYPHMNVYRNLSYALSPSSGLEDGDRRARSPGRGLPRPHATPRPQARTGCPAASGSGVALGRAIIREPKLFLMDEPLSNLDAKLRRPDAIRDYEAAARIGRDDRLRHPRPERSDDDGKQDRGHARGPDPADRCAASALPPSGERLRRAVHRHAADEPSGVPPGSDRRRRRPRRGRRQPALSGRRPRTARRDRRRLPGRLPPGRHLHPRERSGSRLRRRGGRRRGARPRVARDRRVGPFASSLRAFRPTMRSACAWATAWGSRWSRRSCGSSTAGRARRFQRPANRDADCGGRSCA